MHARLLRRTGLALALLLAACGGGGGSTSDATPADGATPFAPAPPPAAWADDGCAACHGGDGGGGGGGPDVRCTSYERLDTYLRDVSTSHAGGAFPGLGDDELLAMEDFLRTADCAGDGPGGIPATHTVSEDGVLHHPDLETNLATCTACHGANLEGTRTAPACAACHGSGGFDDEDERDDD